MKTTSFKDNYLEAQGNSVGSLTIGIAGVIIWPIGVPSTLTYWFSEGNKGK